MSKAALRISALFACTAGAVLATHSAYAVGAATTPTAPAPHPTTSGSSSTPSPTGGPHRFLTAADVPDYEWKFDNNFKDSGRFHPRGDLGAFDADTPIRGFGLGHDGAANGATRDLGRFHQPQGTFRKEAFTFTFQVYPDDCAGTIFVDGVARPSGLPHPYTSQENSIVLGQCPTHTDAKGVTTNLGVSIKASFANMKPDKTFGNAEITGLLKQKAWNDVHIIYDGPNKVMTMFVNGTKTEAPTLGAITVPGQGSTGNYPNDVLIGGPKDQGPGYFSHGNLDNFRFYSNALYPMSTATVGAHAGAGANTSVK